MASRAYELRNARAIGEGWHGYGQKRAAAKLGYSIPAEYHAAKSGRPSPRAPIAPNPFARSRSIPQGGEVGMIGNRIGIEAPFTPAAMRHVERELKRYRPDRRADVWVGSVQMFKRNGASVGWILDRAKQTGSLFEFITDAFEAYDYEDASGGTTVAFTVL